MKTSHLMIDLMAKMKTHKNVKCDVNVKIKNIRTRLFREVEKKSQQNLVSKSDTATKTDLTLKKTYLTSCLGVNV